ncbi:phage portal protein [Caulifigura coniformis]|nr:phage portal protein [Caulifigura coniformis]
MRKVQRRQLQASYDAAQTTELNQKYWKNADLLDADSANDPGVRATLRSRSRYECLESNGFLRGMVQTLVNDTIGRGPRLQMKHKNLEFNAFVETKWRLWAKQIKLGRKLRTARTAKAVDGECFLQFHTNRKIRGPVQLDIANIEADQITNPLLANQENAIDGIEFDEWGNPTTYHRLKKHPGSAWGYDPTPEKISADEIIHLFRQDRPGQHRGIPEFTPSLPLGALLRDYTLATLAAARTSAKHTAVMETAAESVEGESFDETVEGFDTVDIDYDTLTALPHGWKMNAFKPEQPTTTYQMFRNAILAEMGRPANMPYNVAALDSAGHNYASGRLDYQAYDLGIRVERSEWDEECMDRIFEHFMDELWLSGLLDQFGVEPEDEIPHGWFWDARKHVDPSKESGAQGDKLENLTTTLADEYAEDGADYDEKLVQRAKELKRIKDLETEYGIKFPSRGGAPAPFAEDDEDVDAPPQRRSGKKREFARAA